MLYCSDGFVASIRMRVVWRSGQFGLKQRTRKPEETEMQAHKNMSLNTRLLATILATVIALIVLFAGALYTERSLLLKDRQEKVRNLVEVAHGVIAQHEKAAGEGKMSREAAQAGALAVIRNMRYDNIEYFWVNDMAPKVLMHAAKPDLEGKDMSSLKDPNGKYLFNEFVTVVKKDGKGFVDYYWPKAGEQDPVPRFPMSWDSPPGAGSSAAASTSTT